MENGARSSTAVETTTSKALFSDNAMIGSVDMANYPEIELTVTRTKESITKLSETHRDLKKSEKVNGDSHSQVVRSEERNDDSLSDREGALVIDETPVEMKQKKRKRSVPSEFKGFKKRILAQASQITAKRATEKNTFSNDSIKKTANILGYNEKPVLTITKIPKAVSENFEKSSENEIEITRDSNTLNKFESGRKSTDDVEIIRENRPSEKPNDVKPKRSSKGTKQKKTEKVASNQKQEYAQYLGLQPALKFKCIRCGQSNFPSLADLNEHRQQCSAVGTSPAPTAPSPNSTNFKITRKVFLCSACGTYYEVWNLFLHMREVHHRHICLICLGLFSAAEKLSSHLSIKHDAPPKKYETVADFRSENEGQVFVMCVTCEKMFTESDDFSQHVCEINSNSKESSRSSGVKNRAKSVENSDPISTSHATAKVGSKAIQGEMRVNVIEKNVLKNNSKIHLSQKTLVSKNVSKIKNKILPSEHVTADTSLISSTNVEENIDEKCSSDNINRANIEIEKSSDNVQIVSKEDLKIDHKTNDDTLESDKSKPENVETNQNTMEAQNKVVHNQENINTLQKDTESISDCEIKKDDNQSLNFDSVENSNDTNKKFYDTESPESSANKKLVSVKNDSDNTVNNLTDVCERFSDSNTTDNEKRNLNDTINFEDKALETSEIKPNVCDNTCNISDETTNTSNSLNSSIELSGENKREPDVMAFQTKINKCNEIDRKSNDILNQEDLLSVHTDTNPDENIDKPDTATDKDFPVTLESPKETDESCKISEVINKQQIDAKSALVDSPPDTISDTEELKSEIADCKYNQDLKAISDDKDLESERLSTNAESSEESHEDNSESEDDSDDVASEPVSDSRRVPKVTLRIPPRSKMDEETFQMDSDSDDSFKLTMEIDEKDVVDPDGSELDKVDPEKMNLDISESNKIEEKDKESELKFERKNDRFPTAGPDVTVIELGVRPSLDKVTIQTLLKDFIHATCNTCAYCNHARKIAVNGKQLGLHMIAEHRFSAIADSITAEELLPETFVKHIEEHFEELRTKYFNLESYDDAEPEQMTPYDRTYECFRCRFVTTVHKELYLHNRKMHQKTILLCIMCKSTFYSYSELLCHLCPGNYTGAEVAFRCCLCPVDSIPSAFRLMVHLRKRHHACDVCLDACGDQSRLSNHVWKHKLHHLCYRCGIAYRNKPDITRHLFWKHGTESVLCKRCLSKKWPHVYHFCAPPLSFTCEDCGLSFTKAVALVVHRRLHTNAKSHACTEENCEQKFISKRLLERHINAHREPIPIDPPTLESEANASEEIKPKEIANEENHVPEVMAATVEDQKEDAESKIKPVVDVYDLPALNLSESDSDSDDDDEKKQAEQMKSDSDLVKPKDSEIILENESVLNTIPEPEKPVPVVDGIWDDFKNYQASVEKRDFVLNEIDIGRSPLDRLAEAASLEALKVEASKEETVINKDGSILGSPEVVNCDHAYCAQIKPFKEEDESDEKNKENGEVDHDYCTSDKEQKENRTEEMDSEQTEKVKEKSKSPRKKNSGSSSSSSSSSDSDSSSCTCGSNCSCSSSNSGTSSSSSSNSDSGSSGSEGKRRAAARKQRRKERAKNRNKSSETVDVTVTDEPEKPLAPPVIPIEIHESDLYTTESETDEDFYDEHPHRFAKKLIEEKKNRLIMEAASGDSPALNGNFIETSRSSTPNIVETPVEARKKSKVKSKKRKKNQKSIMRQQPENVALPPTSEIANYYDHSPVIPVNRSINVTPRPINMMVSRPSPGTLVVSGSFGAGTGGSGSETDGNLRSSKRRRVPNKFYGYSSDDDSTAVKPPEPPQLEWNKEDLPSPPRIAPLPVTPAPESSFVGTTWKRQIPEKQSSSDSDGDSDGLHIDKPLYPSIPVPPIPIPTDRQQLQQRPNENLYCYCQCPYDEVSEMIACDAKNCKIEWFHFECVGIMVPPKGKWYCPDCRNKQSSLAHPRPSEYFMS